MENKYFKVTQIKWDFDKGYPQKPQSLKTCQRYGVDTTYYLSAESDEDLIDIISDNTGWCIFSASIEEINEADFNDATERG